MAHPNLVATAEALETIVEADITKGRATDGTVALLAAANELRRRNRERPDREKELADAVLIGGLSIRAAAARLGATVGEVRGAVKRRRNNGERSTHR
jgi:DNA-directed RNA polymerase specialized sigma24 family protein